MTFIIFNQGDKEIDSALIYGIFEAIKILCGNRHNVNWDKVQYVVLKEQLGFLFDNRGKLVNLHH